MVNLRSSHVWLTNLLEKYFIFLSDFFGIASSFFLARIIRIGDDSFLYLKSWEFFGFTLTIYFVFYLFDLYNVRANLFRLSSYSRSILGVIALVPILSLYIFALPPDNEDTFTRSVLGLFFLIFLPWSFISRFLIYKCISGKTISSQWLIINNNHDTDFLLDHLKNETNRYNYKMNFSFVGNKNKNEDILITMEAQNWDGIIINDGTPLEENITKKIMSYRLSGKSVCRLSDFYEFFLLKIPVFSLKDHWFIFAGGFHLLHNIPALKLKRMGDILLSLVFLILTLPLTILISILIKLDSNGPVFYTQTRRGLDNKNFTIIKFRSMEINSEKNGDAWTQKKDKRITTIGKFIRLFRLDELPQLFNILRGEMSFVGPRPENLELIKMFEKEIPFYNTRHTVKPGLTGWAQILYSYGSSVNDAREKFQYDLYYIKKFSFYLDLAILIKTVRVVLFGRGR